MDEGGALCAGARSKRPDRGLWLPGYRRFTIATDIQVHFCDPQSPWQCESNENTNGLVRQYMPVGIDIFGHLASATAFP